MSETLLEWSKFEKALIKFVETKKDARFLRLRRGCYVSYFGLWDEFSEKWKVSNETCQSQWQNIINTYDTINAEPQNTFERRNMKYLDGRLSFLDPFIKQKMLERVPRKRRKENKSFYAATKAETNTPPHLDTIKETSTNDSSSSISLGNSNCSSNTVRDTKENIKSTKSVLITEETDKECCINFLSHVVTEKFDEFDERLIDYVKDYPILYDVRVSLNIEPTIRKLTEAKLWKVLMKKTDMSESMCREKWRQIRVEYFCVRKALDFNITIENPSLLKYLDGSLNFLEPVYLVIKLFSVKILTCKPLEEIIRNRGCAWDDIQLNIIQFVKKNPIINNAFNINRRDLHKDFWIQVSKHLHVSADCCMRRWNRIKYANIKFLEKNAGKKLDYTSLFNFRFKALSFLNKQDECIQLFNLKVDENIDNSSNIEEFEDVIKYEEVELVKCEPQNINFYDNVMEMEDTSFVPDKNFESYIKPHIVSHFDEPQPSTSANFISPGLEISKSDDSRPKDSVNRSSKQHYSLNLFNDASLCFKKQLIKLEPEEVTNFNNTDNIENTSFVNCTSGINPDFVSYNDEPQPSTSSNVVSARIHDSKSADSMNEDNIGCTAKRKYISTNDNDLEELNAVNIHKLNTNDFFHHIGRFVSEHFSEESQQEFRVQCWDLLNSFRLDKDV